MLLILQNCGITEVQNNGFTESMDFVLLNEELVRSLQDKACSSERLRMHLDLRTTPDDGSQRMLNVLQPGTKVPIHRHQKTSETAICIEGCIEWIFYEELPNMDAGGPIHNGDTAADESCFREVARFRICPREGQFGIQIPLMSWHTIKVLEDSVIFEAKDGRYSGSSHSIN